MDGTTDSMPAPLQLLFDAFGATASQRWRERRDAWRAREDLIDAARLEVLEVTEGVAKGFVCRHDYSGSYPVARLHYGLVDRRTERLLGVCVLGVPMQDTVLSNVFPKLERNEATELSRLVLLDDDVAGANTESFLVARAFRVAAARGLRGAVAFSDPVPRRRADGSFVTPGNARIVIPGAQRRLPRALEPALAHPASRRDGAHGPGDLEGGRARARARLRRATPRRAGRASTCGGGAEGMARGGAFDGQGEALSPSGELPLCVGHRLPLGPVAHARPCPCPWRGAFLPEADRCQPAFGLKRHMAKGNRTWWELSVTRRWAGLTPAEWRFAHEGGHHCSAARVGGPFSMADGSTARVGVGR